MNALRVLLTLSVVAMYVVLGALVCWLAGTWHLPGIWAVFVVQGIAGIIGLWTLDEELIKERLRPRGKDQDPFAPLILSILLLAMLAIAALDLGRWHISDNVPHIVGFIAIIAQALGWAGFFWAMKVNQFFSSAIRLQPDRQQYAISEGPYAFIRHPGYAFGSLAFITQGAAMGSWLATIPGVAIIAYLIYRTILEENMLHGGLAGYDEYAAHVKYRWIPGIW